MTRITHVACDLCEREGDNESFFLWFSDELADEHIDVCENCLKVIKVGPARLALLMKEYHADLRVMAEVDRSLADSSQAKPSKNRRPRD